MRDRVRVLVVGPSPDLKGGISRVIRLMVTHAPRGLSFVQLRQRSPKTHCTRQNT